jgi:hypothetical protein
VFLVKHRDGLSLIKDQQKQGVGVAANLWYLFALTDID